MWELEKLWEILRELLMILQLEGLEVFRACLGLCSSNVSVLSSIQCDVDWRHYSNWIFFGLFFADGVAEKMTSTLPEWVRVLYLFMRQKRFHLWTKSLLRLRTLWTSVGHQLIRFLLFLFRNWVVGTNLLGWVVMLHFIFLVQSFPILLIG